jgi:hypothetical protein
LDLNTPFIWQVEAVFYNDSQGIIEQRGEAGESSFVLDISAPARVQTTDAGVLYGF